MTEGFWTCGVKGCSHTQHCKNPIDIHRYTVDKEHMVAHYRWDHADMVGTKVNDAPPGVAFGDRYDYGPIPDSIGPTFTYESETSTWAEICRFEGRM